MTGLAGDVDSIILPGRDWFVSQVIFFYTDIQVPVFSSIVYVGWRLPYTSIQKSSIDSMLIGADLK